MLCAQSLRNSILYESYSMIVKCVASSRWPYDLNSASRSIEATIGETHTHFTIWTIVSGEVLENYGFSHPSRHLIYQLIGLRNEYPEAINFNINEVIEYGLGHIMLYNKEKKGAVFGKGKMRSIRICSKYVKSR